MMRLFKDLLIAYFVACVAGTVTIAVFAYVLGGSIPTFFVVAVAWTFLASFVLELWGNARMKKILALHNEACRIEAFLGQIEPLAGRKSAKPIMESVQMLLVAGNYTCGRFQTAEHILRNLHPFEGKNLSQVLANLSYYQNWSLLLMMRGDFSEADKAITEAERWLIHPKLTANVKADMANSCAAKRIRLAVMQGNTEGAETFLTQALKSESRGLVRASYYYVLGLCYEQTGENEKLQDCCRQLLAIGGDSYYAAWAKEQLTTSSGSVQ